MIQTTRWRPDTCGCEIEYEWDDSVPEAQRVHTYKQGKQCPLHASLAGGDAYQECVHENQSKNQGIGHLVKEHPELNPNEIKWEMNPDRSVKIHLPASARANKVSINAKAQGKFKKVVNFE